MSEQAMQCSCLCHSQVKALREKLKEAQLRIKELEWSGKVNHDETKQYEDSLKARLGKLEKVAEEARKLNHRDDCTDANNCCADECFCGYDELWKALSDLDEKGEA